MTKEEKALAELEEQTMLDTMMYEYLHETYPPRPWGVSQSDWEEFLSHFPSDYDWDSLPDDEFEYMIRNL